MPQSPFTFASSLAEWRSSPGFSIERFCNRLTPTVFSGLVQVSDGALLGLCWLLAIACMAPSKLEIGPYAVAAVGATLVGMAYARKRGTYSVLKLRHPLLQMRRLAGLLLCIVLVSGVVLLMLGGTGPASEGWLAIWVASSAVSLGAQRVLLSFLIPRWMDLGRLSRKFAVVGGNSFGYSIAARIVSDPQEPGRVVGIFDEAPCEGFGVEGGLSALLDLSRRQHLDAIVIAIPHLTSSDAEGIVRKLRCVVADVYFAADIRECPVATVTHVKQVGDKPLISLRHRPLDDWEAVQKAIFDRLFASALLVLLSPLFLIIAIAIRCETRGPVFFLQPRYGFNGLPFTVFKFRTMHHAMSDLLANEQTSRNDPRVTAIGKWLRKLSLDELPQLLNVLRGEMSLVGPRPHAPNTRAEGRALDEVVADYAERHRIKPGITGWAQVNGCRGEIRTIEQIRERVRYDLEYIEKWSMTLDVRILLLTLVREVISRNAF